MSDLFCRVSAALLEQMDAHAHHARACELFAAASMYQPHDDAHRSLLAQAQFHATMAIAKKWS